MASLTQISITARKIVRYSLYALVFIIIARYAFKGGVVLFQKFFPPKAPKPTVAFGKMPKLPFPDKKPPQDLKFKLELPEGILPKLAEQAFVYEMPAFSSNIKVVDEAKVKAQALGFDQNGKPIVESIPNVYIFQKVGQPSNLTMNIITGVFSISYDTSKNPQVLTGTPQRAEEATSQFRTFLASASLVPADLRDGPATNMPLKVQSGNFVPAVSISEANLIKINLFRKGFGEKGSIPSVTPDMPEANVWAIISGFGRQIIAAEYHYFPIDEKKSATYPIKTSEKAWEELNEGKGFLANLGNNPDGNITIRKVYLAYFDPSQYAKYYQPIVVFEGDNDFYSYVPGIPDEFYGQE